MTAFLEAYHALCDVYLKGSWIGEVVKKPSLTTDKAAVRLVYSVVEREFLSEYRIARLTERAPKPSVKILLKMGMTLIDVFDAPDHAVVNEITELTKKVGKGGVSGFINAVLRRYAREGRGLYPDDPDVLLSVRSNRPLWVVKRYVKELGREDAEKSLSAKSTVLTHVRPALSFGKEALRTTLLERSVAFTETDYGFYFEDMGKISPLLAEGKATVSSWSSVDVCESVPVPDGAILDLCAAPGGKSVFLAEKYGVEVIACDLYPHRVALIEKYAERMHVDTIRAMVSDSRALRKEWEQSFSVVLADVPCSGFGSLSSNQDVVLHRTEHDLEEILKTQSELILMAGNYVRAGGALVYATCSDLPSEDEYVVRAFLEKRSDFVLEKEKRTDREKGGGDSYYVAVLRKK